MRLTQIPNLQRHFQNEQHSARVDGDWVLQLYDGVCLASLSAPVVTIDVTRVGQKLVRKDEPRAMTHIMSQRFSLPI